MAQTTRTTNPLPLQDLEPHRFEDLVRQLLYDFRNWRRLESTGRSGSDDGFDARGWEIVSEGEPQLAPEDIADGDDANSPNVASDRIWLIQCKREKEIGPTRLVGYVEAIPPEETKELHGIVLAAACDFSKKARDEFREACRVRGIQEWHLWSRSEIEDMLFRPANDHLLFAYFGFSLQVRKRSMKALWSSRMTTKRRAKKYLAEQRYRYVLVRDASDERYPYLDENEKLERIVRGRWKFYQFDKLCHNGVSFVTRSFFAYIGEDAESWDYIKTCNLVTMDSSQDPWAKEDKRDWGVEAEARNKWMTLSETNCRISRLGTG